MSKRQILMLIGVWVVILAAPGFPPTGRTVLTVVTGIGLIVFGYRMKSREEAAPEPRQDLSFTDYKNTDQPVPHNDGPVA